jgi:hypothetical protein
MSIFYVSAIAADPQDNFDTRLVTGSKLAGCRCSDKVVTAIRGLLGLQLHLQLLSVKFSLGGVFLKNWRNQQGKSLA